jgi:hypothetical protein
MWECFNCAFQNVDAAALCARCRARRPEPGEKPKGRSYYAAETAARERFADTVLTTRWRESPTPELLDQKWSEIVGDPAEIQKALAVLELRQYQLRDTFKTLINILENPKLRNREEQLEAIIRSLQDW